MRLPARAYRLAAVALALLLTGGCAGPDSPPDAAPAAGAAAGRVAMQCGALPIAVVARADAARLEAAGRQYRLERVRAASGARYRATDDHGTSLWQRGDRARLTLSGEPLPECLAAGAVARPFEARGNEPFWRVVLDGETLTLERPGQAPVSGRFRWHSRAADVSTGETTLAGDVATLTVRFEPCRDSMSGMPHPRTVALEWRGRTLGGCGGDPARLLRGPTWIVDELPDHDLVDPPRATLRFLDDSRAAGRATCNRYTARWTLTGEGLSFDRGAMTRKACPPALMDQETRFMDRLERVHRFRLMDDGRLELRGPAGALIRLRAG